METNNEIVFNLASGKEIKLTKEFVQFEAYNKTL